MRQIIKVRKLYEMVWMKEGSKWSVFCPRTKLFRMTRQGSYESFQRLKNDRKGWKINLKTPAARMRKRSEVSEAKTRKLGTNSRSRKR